MSDVIIQFSIESAVNGYLVRAKTRGTLRWKWRQPSIARNPEEIIEIIGKYISGLTDFTAEKPEDKQNEQESH